MAVDHDRRLSSGVGNAMQPMLKESYTTPRPASRVGTSSDAAKYLRRSRGSASLWLVKRCSSIDLEDDDDDDGGEVDRQSARAPRLTGDEASEIFRRSHGSVGVVLDETSQAGYSSPRPQPRLPSREATANARRRTQVFTADDVGGPSDRPRSRLVSAEAEANATKNAGSMSTIMKRDDRPRTSESRPASGKRTELSLCLDGMSPGDVDTPRPRQRVRPEAEEIARRNAGTCAAALAGRLAGDRACEVRASGDGRTNCEASRCGSVGTLFSTYGRQSGDQQRPDSRQQGPGSEIAKHGKTGTLCFQMTNYGNLPRSPRPESRLRSEGKRYVCRNRGDNMASCLNQAAKKPVGRTHLVVGRTKTEQLRRQRSQQNATIS